MTVTNHLVGETVNLAEVLNSKLEKPILQSELGLDAQATLSGQAVRFNEFSLKHNADGTFKGINQGDITLTTGANATGKAIRYDEFSVRHNDNGTIKQQLFNKSDVANPNATANTYGAVVNSTIPAGYTSIVPLGASILFDGTFNSETVTAQIVVTFSDTSSLSLVKTVTEPGTVSLSVDDFLSIVKDGVFITNVSYSSQSTIASSTVTVTFKRYGFFG